MMSPLASSDCAEKCVHLQQANKGSARKKERFVKVIMGKDHDKFMYLPPPIAPKMNCLSGRELTIEDAGGCRWPMMLTTVNGGLAFTNGWVPFYSHHNLEERSILVFKYKVGTDSLFVHDYSKDGSETLQKNLGNSTNGIICQSSETVSLEGVVEGVSQQVPDKSGSSDALPIVLKEVYFDGMRIPTKKRTPAMDVRPGSAPRNQESVPIGPRSESRKCVELPIQIPPVPSSRCEDFGRVVYLKDPKERIWPFVNLNRPSVKVFADKWEKFCAENGINEIGECGFEVDGEVFDSFVFRVSVVGRPFN